MTLHACQTTTPSSSLLFTVSINQEVEERSWQLFPTAWAGYVATFFSSSLSTLEAPSGLDPRDPPLPVRGMDLQDARNDMTGNTDSMAEMA
jgi:hypothetical protein